LLITILGSSKKLDLEEEIDLESDMSDIGDMGDLDDDELSLGEGLSGSQVLQSTSKTTLGSFARFSSSYFN